MARKQNSTTAEFNKPFPTALRTLMAERNTTQSDLAEHLNKTRQTISLYCNGSSAPDLETLVKIADYFNTSSDYLLGITPDPDKKPSAVNDLGLSPKAVDNIKYVQKDADRRLFIDGINMLLEDFRFFLIAKDIKQFSDIVKTEKEYVLNYLDNNYPQNDPLYNRDTYMFLSDEELANTLLDELKTKHPDIAVRISVSCGRSALDGKLRSIVEDFRSGIEWVTGYMKYMADVTWGRSDLN